MRNLVTFAILAVAAGFIAIGTVNTHGFACGDNCELASTDTEEAYPAWAACNLNLDCLRF